MTISNKSIRKIKSYFISKDCYFYQEDNCILSKSICPLCSNKIKKIKGIYNPEFYHTYITNRNHNHYTLIIACFALLFSLISLIIDLIKLIKNK
jgi:hypothetical protein